MVRCSRFVLLLFVLLLGSTFRLGAAIENLGVAGKTATQAVLVYNAPDESPCAVEASQSPTFRPLIHDVNPNLFPGAQQDDRGGSLKNGRTRIFVLGKRAAEKAADGKRYSRALKAYTLHYIRVTCGQDTATTDFATTNIPVGVSYNDPLPVDPLRPGEYAWPTLNWSNRGEKIIDPLTGLELLRLTSPLDKTEVVTGPFPAFRDANGTWTNLGNTPFTLFDGGLAGSSRATPGFGFLDARQSFYHGGTRDAESNGLAYLKVAMRGWCAGANCASATPDERTIQACLTVDGINCASDIKDQVLSVCVTGSAATCANNNAYQFTMGDTRPILGYWASDPSIDLSSVHTRGGAVNRDGTKVTIVYGDKFNLQWTNGSTIIINRVQYWIEKVENEDTLILSAAPDTRETNATYTSPNFGLLIRKKTRSPHSIVLLSPAMEYGMASTPGWDSSADGETAVSCAEKTSPGPNNEQGFHCNVGQLLYWIGQETGTVSRLGVPYFPDRNQEFDGWPSSFCGGVFWDRSDPNVFYCRMNDTSTPSNGIIVKAQYVGNNQDIGNLSLYDRLVECKPGRTGQPCFEFTNLTPASRKRDLLTQLRAFHPDAANFKTPGIDLVARQGDRLILMARRDSANNDLLGYMITFDPATGSINGALSSWKHWPLRWTVLHGPGNIADPNWLWVPSVAARGATSGVDFYAGNGPYRTTITSGAIDQNAVVSCPPRPADSPIPSSEWPTGDSCLIVTVDGEPCDPTPAVYRAGRVRLAAGSDVITGIGTTWSPIHDGSQVVINNTIYNFTYVSPVSGKLSAPADANFEGEYAMPLEPINNPKCGNAGHAYLQDAEPRDIFCMQSDPNANCAFGVYQNTEFMRLLVKQGTRWTLERRYGAQSARRYSVPANSFLLAAPATCNFGQVYPCSTAVAYWNFTQDPQGLNRNGSTVRRPAGDPAGGHGSTRPGLEVYSVASIDCPTYDGDAFTCYGVRQGSVPDVLTATQSTVSNNPAFSGRVGLGTPNSVDAHPSVPLFAGVTDMSQRNWFLDARPQLGDSSFSGSFGNPAARISGNLYRFAPSQFSRLRRKILPTMASCGTQPLKDVSGPASVITDSKESAYTYCAVERDGECYQESTAGEVYFNCPQISRPYCQYWGIGNAFPDMRDVCIGDNGAYTQAITQTGIHENGVPGSSGRVLTYGLSRYRLADVFWNAKSTPDAKWILFRSMWTQGLQTSVFMAKLPPLPQADGVKRNDFLPMTLWLEPPPDMGIDNAVVEFGYNEQFHCTSRQEACVKGTQSGNDYSFGLDGVAGVSCAGSCEVTLPVIPNRVVYYRARYRDVDNNEVIVTDPGAGVPPL